MPVPFTANPFDNIDAIPCSTGAATLNQVRHLPGAGVLRQRVHGYLTKFAYRNARLDDFIGTPGQAAGRDLAPWTASWLHQAGVNTVAAAYHWRGGAGLTVSACPDLVYPNYQDGGYVNVALDARSLATARAHLGTVDDPRRARCCGKTCEMGCAAARHRSPPSSNPR